MRACVRACVCHCVYTHACTKKKEKSFSFTDSSFCSPQEYEVAGGVGHAEMMERSNLIALVAGGTGQKFSNRNG